MATGDDHYVDTNIVPNSPSKIKNKVVKNNDREENRIGFDNSALTSIWIKPPVTENRIKLETQEEVDSIDEIVTQTSGIEGTGSEYDTSQLGTTAASSQIDSCEVPSSSKWVRDKRRKLGHRRIGSDGQVTYKNISASRIISSIQLGVEHAIGRMATTPERDLLMEDFMTVETIPFSSSGSDGTPTHGYSRFNFQTYAPVAFKYFRELFGINHQDFLESFCKNPLKELPASGRSGSLFYVTEDDKFIVKTMQSKECSFLQNLLPGYYLNLHQNPATLLPKYFGIFCYKCDMKKIKLVAMSNILPSSITIHQTYDLKGATCKSRATKQKSGDDKLVTYKDLDFLLHHPNGFFLENESYNTLMKTIKRDCTVLESFKIMDYSLLLGVSKVDNWMSTPKVSKEYTSQLISDDPDSGREFSSVSTVCTINSTDLLNNWLELNSNTLSTEKKKLTKLGTLQSKSPPFVRSSNDKSDEPSDNVLNRSVLTKDLVSHEGIPALNGEGEPVIIFIGIIDILQSYKIKKRLEHTFKSIVQDGSTISVHNPSFYAERFQKFMFEKVFKKYTSIARKKTMKRFINKQLVEVKFPATKDNNPVSSFKSTCK